MDPVECRRGSLGAPASDDVDLVAGLGQPVGHLPGRVLHASGCGLEALDDQGDSHGGDGVSVAAWRRRAAKSARRALASGVWLGL